MSGTVEILVFEIGGKAYGLRGSEVREVVRAVALAPMPHAPAMVEGIMNLRGRVVPVLDLRVRLGLPAKPLQTTDHFLIARAGNRTVALRVDRARDLMDIEETAIERASDAFQGFEEGISVVKQPNELIVLLDLDRFLSRTDLVGVREEAASFSQDIR